MTRLAGIFGYPLDHSISPDFQQAAFDHLGLPLRYRLWPTPPERLAAAVGGLSGNEYIGANVTVPHKEAVLGMVDRVDGWARSIGAVNTIAKEDNRLVGYNTDADGLVRSLRNEASFDPPGRSALILGAGGAARATAFALAREGLASLVIANRTVERATRLAEHVGDIVETRGIRLDPEALGSAAGEADLIVNCTSVGMAHGTAEGVSPINAEFIPAGALVFDVVYNPAETPLLAEAKRAGARTLAGLAMLIYQGAAAFELWTGRPAPVDVMFAAGRRALGQDIADSVTSP